MFATTLASASLWPPEVGPSPASPPSRSRTRGTLVSGDGHTSGSACVNKMTLPIICEEATVTAIDRLTLEAPDPDAAEAFTLAAFGAGLPIRYAPSRDPSSGFRGSVRAGVVAGHGVRMGPALRSGLRRRRDAPPVT